MSSTDFASTRLGRFLHNSRRWVVLAMLLALHEALISEPGGAYQRIWLLIHFGLFLLWQPFFEGDREVERVALALLAAITGTILYFLPGWLIGAWICVLMGILGGKVFTAQAARRGRFYLVAFFYLASMMLLWTVPRLVLREPVIPEPIAAFATLLLPLSLVALVFLPFNPKDDDSRQVFDFFYAVLVFQLVVVLVLGSIALMRYTDGEYFTSAGLTVIGFGATLFVLAVFWGPREGFGGLRTYLSRYLMSVGMPFETWMRRVAELAEHEQDPQRFLGQALVLVGELPWIRGGRRTARASSAWSPRTSCASASTGWSSPSTRRSRSPPRSSCTCASSRRWWANSTRASAARRRCGETPTSRPSTRRGRASPTT